MLTRDELQRAAVLLNAHAVRLEVAAQAVRDRDDRKTMLENMREARALALACSNGAKGVSATDMKIAAMDRAGENRDGLAL